MHLHPSRLFQEHVRMLLHSLRAFCKAPRGAGSIWKYLGALARATEVSERDAYGFCRELHFADVLWRLLQLLTVKQITSTGSGYYNVLSASGNFRNWELVWAAWFSDCPEYRDQHHLERHVCFRCECPKNELGEYVHPNKEHPRGEHNLCRILSDANSKAGDAEHSSRYVHRVSNMFRYMPCTVIDHPKLNLLHTMEIGMLYHFQTWIFYFMTTHEQLNKYNAIWLSVSASHNPTPKNEAYGEVSQWIGKEMKERSQYLLGVVTQSLRGGNPAQHPIFNHTIECTRALLEFNMYARYTIHDDATLTYMEDALHSIHTLKDVFLLGRAGKKAKAKANALRTELMKKRKVDEETHAETWTPYMKRREMHAWPDYICHQIDISKKFDPHFKFLKINLMSHWAEQVHQYGVLQHYSAERYEQAHKTNLKDCRALHDNTQDATHPTAIYTSTREFIKYKSRNKTYISDEQLHAQERCI
jgi:hypothetical protein